MGSDALYPGVTLDVRNIGEQEPAKQDKPTSAEIGPMGEFVCPMTVDDTGRVWTQPTIERTRYAYTCGVNLDPDLNRQVTGGFDRSSRVARHWGVKSTETISRTTGRDLGYTTLPEANLILEKHTYVCEIGYSCSAQYTCWMDISKPPLDDLYWQFIAGNTVTGFQRLLCDEGQSSITKYDHFGPVFSTSFEVVAQRTITKELSILPFQKAAAFPSKSEVCDAEFANYQFTNPPDKIKDGQFCYSLLRDTVKKAPPPTFEYSPICCALPQKPNDGASGQQGPGVGMPLSAVTSSQNTASTLTLPGGYVAGAPSTELPKTPDTTLGANFNAGELLPW